MRHLLPIPPILLLVFLLSLSSTPVLAADGVFEINQTCATGPGCFTGDSAGLPVTLAVRGSYRLTGNLGFNSVSGPPSEDFILITGDDVKLDLGGFTLRCSNVITGAACPSGSVAGTQAGIEIVIGADRAGIRNGSIYGMPGAGIRGGEEAQIEALTIDSSGSDGIDAGNNARIERCTVTGSGGDGIRATAGAIVSHNIVRGSVGEGILVGDSGVVSHNVSRSNGGVGIQASRGSIVEGNTVRFNDIGIGWDDEGGLARDNVIFDSRSFGMAQVAGSVTNGFVFRNNVIRDNNGTNSNPQTDGGLDAGGNYCGITPGCP